MLGKLYKYDFRCTARKAVPMCILYAIVCVTLRIMSEMDIDSMVFNVIGMIMTTIFEIMALLLGIYVIVTSVVRIDKNLFSDEGYLMHTLPVKPSAHIWSKTFNVATWGVISAVVTVIGCFIVFADVNLKNVKLLLKRFAEFDTPEVITLILIVLVVVCILATLAISGVTSGAVKNSMPVFKKGIVKVGVGIVAYILLMTFMVHGFEFIEWMGRKLDISYEWETAYLLVVTIIILTIINAVCFVLSNYLMKRKLNMQ